MSAREEIKGADRTAELPGLRFGPFTFDPRRLELLRHGRPISMPASQMRLLTLFIERRGELVTREEIAARLWADTRTIDVDTGINTAVNRLRRNLQDAPGASGPIETVIGLGYRFVPVLKQPEPVRDISVQAHPAAEASDAAPPAAPQPAAADVESHPFEEIAPAEVADAGTPDRTVDRAAPRLPLQDTGAVTPPGRLRSAERKRWMLAAWVVCALILLLGLGTVALRRSATRAGTAPPASAESVAGQSSGLPAILRVTADEEVGKLTAAAVSPSGRLLAYADPFGVSVHSFASSAKRLLGTRPSFSVDRLSWLPDESGLLMSGTDELLHRQQVWFQPADSPYERLLVENATRATVSPDGGNMAFLRNGNRELWEAAADGQRPRLLRSAAHGETYDLVLWSPAGNRLLATVRKASATAAQGSAADTGTAAAYEFLDAESGSVLHREEGFAASSGYLTRSGDFVFIENATPGPMSGVASIMTVPLDLSSGRMLGAPHRVRDLDARRADSFSASLNGARTAVVLERADIDLFVADLRSPGPELSHVTRLSRDATQTFPHSWTAEGDGILVESDALTPPGERPRWAIFNQPLNGAKATLLAALPGNTAMAQLTPDSRWILFLEFTEFPQRFVGLFRISAGGGRIERVPTTGDVENFRCSASAEGRCVLREAVGNKEFVYYALDPVRGMGEELGRTAWQPKLLGDWGLSADGRTVAVVSHDALHPHISLFQLGSSPSSVQEIAVQGHGTTLAATWAPDGKSLFVECQTESGFEVLSLDLSGQLRSLLKSPFQIWAIPSRDGKKIAFPDLNLTSSLWATEDKP